MTQCSINSNTNKRRDFFCDVSLRFYKGIVALLALIAFLIQSKSLVIVDSFLMASGIFSVKSNILYQFHIFIFKKLLKKKLRTIQKELGELKFISAMGGILLFVGFLFLYFEKISNLGWILILITSFFMFLGCFTDFCLAASMYIFFKKILRR